MRYVDGQLVLRLVSDISDAQLARLNQDFTDIVASGRIERGAATSAEIDDHDEVARPRLFLDFDHRHHARLHQLIRSL